MYDDKKLAYFHLAAGRKVTNSYCNIHAAKKSAVPVRRRNYIMF